MCYSIVDERRYATDDSVGEEYIRQASVGAIDCVLKNNKRFRIRDRMKWLAQLIRLGVGQGDGQSYSKATLLMK